MRNEGSSSTFYMVTEIEWIASSPLDQLSAIIIWHVWKRHFKKQSKTKIDATIDAINYIFLLSNKNKKG